MRCWQELQVGSWGSQSEPEGGGDAVELTLTMLGDRERGVLLLVGGVLGEEGPVVARFPPHICFEVPLKELLPAWFS